ncbi:hypothetical protein MASR2M70_13600 [Bacillota bacterium]
MNGIGTRAGFINAVSPGQMSQGALDPDLNTANKITTAFVQNAGSKEARAEIVSGGDVDIHGKILNDLSSAPNNTVADYTQPVAQWPISLQRRIQWPI